MTDIKHWSIATALEQIKKCDFECEAGPLANNVGWRWLLAAAGMTCEDEGCPHYGTPHSHPAAEGKG